MPYPCRLNSCHASAGWFAAAGRPAILGFALALLAGSPALAHKAPHGDGGPSHRQIDEPLSLEQEALLLERAAANQIGVNPALLNRGTVRQAGGLVSGTGRAALARMTVDDPARVGQWGPLQPWPVIGVFMSLLNDGQVLVFDSVGDAPAETIDDQDFTRAMIWNPQTGISRRVDVDTGYNLFCSGFASLPDGRLFVAGGNADRQLNGLRETHVFNPLTRHWTLGQRMSFDRWYPAVTPLGSGEMLITGGGFATPELRQLDGSIRRLDTASSDYWSNRDYPWLQQAPNGRTTFLGPANQLGLIDTAGDGDWQRTSARDYAYRGYGSYVVFDIGKALVAGGGFESPSHSQTSAILVDLNSANSRWTGFMNHRRRQHNLTVLPDGKVLATGGFSSNADFIDLENSVFAAELWTPFTGKWVEMAEEDRARNYHSTALLLPDGRVLSAGGGICGDCQAMGYIQKNAQVFSPPYLFRQDGSGRLAPRPTLLDAPGRVGYDEPFIIGSNRAADIRKAAMIRTGSVTHSTNMEQRYIPLDFALTPDGQLELRSPATANIAPPGHYLLFILDAAGVPSVASIVALNTRPLATTPG